MPIARFQLEDGRVARFEVPEGTSPEQAQAMMTEHFAPTQEKPKVAPLSKMDRVLKGITDPIEGGAQLLTEMLPKSVVNAGDAAQNWIADKTGLMNKLPQGGSPELFKQNEAEYQARRGGDTGTDWARIAGNVVSPANLALAAKMPMAAAGAGLGAKSAVAALGGGASALTAPVTEGDYWTEKGKQVGAGALFGGATPAVMSGISRVISPNASTNEKLALLLKEGVKPTIGQTLGGGFNRAEEKLQMLPILGDAITSARKRASNELNVAATNRALSPIGESLPKNIIGNEAVLFARQKLGQEYDKLLPKLTTQADDKFAEGLNGLKQMIGESALDPKYAAKFDQILNDRILGKFQGQNSMSGETLKQTQEYLRKEIARFGGSQDPDARLLSDALKEAGDQLNQLVTRSNPQYAKELNNINQGYANFKRVQKAASSVAAEDGVFNPAQLHNAVKVADKSKDKARFAEGNALMQDLSGTGKSVLGDKVADSGTAGRLALGLGGLSTYALSPAIPAALIGGATMYSPQAQSLLRNLVSTRPESAQAIAQALRNRSIMFAPASGAVGAELMK
jgi:hypothetical protein